MAEEGRGEGVAEERRGEWQRRGGGVAEERRGSSTGGDACRKDIFKQDA